jgi:phosphoenolpyruvate mutase
MIKKVYVGMSADILHPGHINILKKASELGFVTVGLLTDKAIVSYKNLPFMSYEQRQDVLSGLKYVDEIVPQNSLDYTENILKLKPDYLVHGDDWRSGIQEPIRKKVIEALAIYGGELIEYPYTEGVSSSSFKNKINENITTDQRKSLLKRMLNAKPTLRFIDIHNALSGIVIENTKIEIDSQLIEFDGMWGSSLTDSTAKGKPDIEAVDTTSRLITLNEILEVTSKPIIYDGDTGGKPEHLVYTIKNLERIGVSAIVIEDKKGLKRNSLFGTSAFQEQEDANVFSEKIRVAKNVKRSSDFLIFARVESLILEKGIEDALFRADKYISAGADGILIHSKNSQPNEIFDFVSKFRDYSDAILIVVPTTYNQVNFIEFQKIGVNIVIYANHLLRSSYPAMINTAKSILINGRSKEAEPNLMSIKDIINFT